MLWDIRTEKSIHQLKNIHHSDIHCMSAINNIWLVTGGADMRFAFTDLRKLAPVRKTVTPAAPADVSIRRDFAAASLGNGRVHLWKAEFGL
jgi:WD40 repeat protein